MLIKNMFLKFILLNIIMICIWYE